MTDDRMALIELVEKQVDGDLVREMLVFAAKRIMEAEIEARTGATKGTRSPMRESRKKRVAVDRPLYCLRNLVEGCFNKLKNVRRGATRYDRTAESFLGFVDIAPIRLWVRHLST